MERLIETFQQRFGTAPAAVAAAPGRLEILGNHTDYNEGFVLSAATEQATSIALARRDGKNASRWSEVAPYVLKLATAQYYNDPIVKYGYMRGSETVDYVEKIRSRHASYQGVRSPHVGFHPSQPRKADKRKNKFDIKE